MVNLKRDIDNFTSGTAQPQLPIKDLSTLEISLPPLEEQRRIAEILSSLDDKIDLLHKQNKTLESLARLLFRHHFIDNAKSEWQIGKLGDYVRIVYGKNLPTKNLLNSGYPVFGGNGQIGYFDKFLYKEPQVLVSCRGEASGKVNISYKESYITNNSLILERSKDKDISFVYLKYFCLSQDFSLFVSGSAQPQITIQSLQDATFIKPNIKDIQYFSQIVSSFETKQDNNSQQILKLEKMRDIILPRLLSGEVRV
ncbi:hypothetical protein CCZ01_06685 [Helicobacter monodelphidis]|uniref:restriction endonuclease subunit S n=1 Tax=Helicobacter sp. 15-1451 TaxID=2004995 RepID=UPI000DCE2292|nr:restriction endonuclease subunit S [Helicobacter sp. 15-1451]RAX57258.1 hypothetical protein CCZ01_06685 [Helicobacter sp. 15-1451]